MIVALIMPSRGRIKTARGPALRRVYTTYTLQTHGLRRTPIHEIYANLHLPSRDSGIYFIIVRLEFLAIVASAAQTAVD